MLGATHSGFGLDRPVKTSQSVNGPSKVSHVQPHSSQFIERTNSQESLPSTTFEKHVFQPRHLPEYSLATMVSLSPVIGCSPPQPLILPPLRVCSLVANKKSTSTRLHSFSLFWSYPIDSLLIASWRLLRPAQTTKKPSRCSTSVAPAEFNLNRSAISCEHADKTLHWLKFAISRRALAEIVCERAL